MTDIHKAEIGWRIWFKGEGRPYRVRACNGRYLICTKPFNARRTVLYCIVDRFQLVRGRDNMIFSRGYEDQEDIDENMRDLASGELEVSYRHRVRLEIERMDDGGKTKKADRACGGERSGCEESRKVPGPEEE